MDQITVEEPKERKIISIDEGQVREHLDKMVLTSVEETLNGLRLAWTLAPVAGLRLALHHFSTF